MFMSRSTITLHRAPDYYSKNVFTSKSHENEHHSKHCPDFDLEGTQYLAKENIGVGAFGIVCKAIDERSENPVAIKKVRDAYKTKSSAKCALREIRILREVSHENVIGVTDVFMTGSGFDKDVYLVMDLMETNLHLILRSTQNLREDHFRYFFYQLMRGLKYLHSAAIIHRDLKPSNLLLNSNCLLKIADFGMARSGPSTRTAPIDSNFSRTSSMSSNLSQYVSTLWYRAPEILLSMGEYDTKVDIWSAGCILAEMLLRREIFPGNDTYSQIRMIIDTLGTPEKKAIKKITSPTIRDFIVSIGPKSSLPLPSICPNSSSEARDVIFKLLQISTWNRPSAEQILQHSFVSKWHNVHNEPTCPERIRRNLQDIERYGEDQIIKGLDESAKYFRMLRGSNNAVKHNEEEVKAAHKTPFKTIFDKFINRTKVS